MEKFDGKIIEDNPEMKPVERLYFLSAGVVMRHKDGYCYGYSWEEVTGLPFEEVLKILHNYEFALRFGVEFDTT